MTMHNDGGQDSVGVLIVVAAIISNAAKHAAALRQHLQRAWTPPNACTGHLGL